MTDPVRAVDRALEILLSFSQERPVLSLTEIAEEVKMSKSTVHRLLATLEAKRFLIRSTETGKYHLGFCFLAMASHVMEDVRQQWALPYMEQLAQECGETVDLAVLDGDHVIYLQVVESKQRVKIAAATGQRLPAYCTATGKAFLAFLPEERVNEIINIGMLPYTESTCIDPAALVEDLKKTHQRGFAISKQEYEKDINAVAAPILAADGFPIVVIAVAGPSFRMPNERMLELGRSIQNVNAAIQHEVGLSALSVMVPRDYAWQ